MNNFWFEIYWTLRKWHVLAKIVIKKNLFCCRIISKKSRSSPQSKSIPCRGSPGLRGRYWQRRSTHCSKIRWNRIEPVGHSLAPGCSPGTLPTRGIRSLRKCSYFNSYIRGQIFTHEPAKWTFYASNRLNLNNFYKIGPLNNQKFLQNVFSNGILYFFFVLNKNWSK